MNNKMTVSAFASLGGHSRWKGKTKKERSEAMKLVRSKGKQKIVERPMTPGEKELAAGLDKLFAKSPKL